MNALDMLAMTDPEDLRNVVLEQGRKIEEMQRSFLALQSLGEISRNLGEQWFGASRLDGDGLHTSADLIDIDWWLPLNLSVDDVTGIYALYYDGSEYVYAGGDFRQIGGVAASNIARYSLKTRNWETIGSGIGVVGVIGGAGGDVYIADFSGGVSKVYVLDGSTWTQVGSTLNSMVRGIAFDGDGVPHICGSFTNAGGDADADRVAILGDSDWESLDAGGVNGNVGVIVFDAEGALYIGGDFTNAGGDADADGIARREAGAWVHVGNGLASPDIVGLNDIVFDSLGRMYVCGRFTSAGGDSGIAYVAELVDDEWVQVGGGGLTAPDYSIRLAVGHDDTLYAFGRFLNAGGDPTADHIAKLSNGEWRGLSNAGGAVLGISDYIACVLPLENGSLIAGGVYHFVGAIQCEGIAIYCKPLNEAIDLIAALFELYGDATIHGADEKATIHDDDELPGADSEDAWSLIKWTWRTVKAWLFSVLAEINSALDQDFTDNATGWTLGTGWSWSDGVGLVKTPGVESSASYPGALDRRSYRVEIGVTVNAGQINVSLGDSSGILIDSSGEYLYQDIWGDSGAIVEIVASDGFDGVIEYISIATDRNIYDAPLSSKKYVRTRGEWIEASAANITVDESGFSGNLTGEDVVDVQALANWVDGAAISAIDPVAPVVITSTSDFEKADYPGLYAIKVKLQAPGGGGGGVTGASSQAACANGGGGGEYAEKFILASALNASVTVTIGAVGAGGAAGNNNGADGGNCSFGSHFNVVGGKGGNGDAASATVPRYGAVSGGAGGTGGTGGDLHIPGGASIPGMCWTINATQAPIGGASFLGSNTRSTSAIGADEAGITGKNWGSGGTGARSSNDANNRAGGDGAPGRCEIELYIK